MQSYEDARGRRQALPNEREQHKVRGEEHRNEVDQADAVDAAGERSIGGTMTRKSPARMAPEYDVMTGR